MDIVTLSVLLVLGFIGGLLHAILPPQETSPSQIGARVFAGIVVALVFGYGMITVALKDLEPLELFVVLAPTVIGMAYVGMDLLKAIVQKATG